MTSASLPPGERCKRQMSLGSSGPRSINFLRAGADAGEGSEMAIL